MVNFSIWGYVVMGFRYHSGETMSFKFHSTLLRCALIGFTFAISFYDLASSYAENETPTPIPNVNSTGSTTGNLSTRMLSIYNEFRSLHGYMTSREKFIDPQNTAAIGGILDRMSSDVTSLSGAHPAFAEKPEVNAILASLDSSLNDATRGFKEGRKGWALWRLRSVANACISCHTSHQQNISFHDPDHSVEGEDAYSQGEFYLATRQFLQAKDAFYRAAMEPQGTYQRIDALRKWLIVFTRVTPHPKEALAQLSFLVKKVQLLPFEREEAASWMVSLKSWSDEPKPQIVIAPLREAENLLRRSLAQDDPIFAASGGTVELLRATTLLHKALDGKDLSKGERGRVLYLLGFSYARLPEFFINELPDIYLEQCIREVPGTDEAARAFRLYREITVQDYTGSGGTHIPPEVQSKLDELHGVAVKGR